jgi:hypothetical protein
MTVPHASSGIQKVDRHPDASMNLLAEAFCERVASSWLNMPIPKIFWFQEADYRHASRAWLDDPMKKEKQAADPLRQDCEFFRWSGLPQSGAAGYTHQESPLGIMVNTRCRGQKLLEIIAEECFHIYQDHSHYPGWRAKTASREVETEAHDFLCSKSDKIQEFLQHSGA